jgi:Co/Zn/Cd efflux system component
MDRTTFYIKAMDCPAEEQMIRMNLKDITSVRHLEFDLANRRLAILHNGESANIQAAIDRLNFGAELIETKADAGEDSVESDQTDTKLLWTVLSINLGVFAVELLAGLIARSMGLVADSLDELADALVYALSIYAITGTVATQKHIARTSGVLQFVLATWGFFEIIRRFTENGPLPNFMVMIVFSCIALIGNATSLYLLRKSKTQEVHIKATRIFTSNDIIVNLGVIISAIFVAVTQNKIPDIVIGAIVFIIVLRGAIRIFKLSR